MEASDAFCLISSKGKVSRCRRQMCDSLCNTKRLDEGTPGSAVMRSCNAAQAVGSDGHIYDPAAVARQVGGAAPGQHIPHPCCEVLSSRDGPSTVWSQCDSPDTCKHQEAQAPVLLLYLHPANTPLEMASHFYAHYVAVQSKAEEHSTCNHRQMHWFLLSSTRCCCLPYKGIHNGYAPLLRCAHHQCGG